MLAMIYGEIISDEIVKLLLNKCTYNINLKNNDGNTLLMLVIMYKRIGSDEIIRLLLRNNIDIDSQNNDGNTALMLATMYQRTDSYEIIRLLLKNNAKIDLQNNDGNTAIMLAVVYGGTNLIKIFRLLLKKKANINLQNKKGKTILTLAPDNNIKFTIRKILGNDGKKDHSYNQVCTTKLTNKNLITFGKINQPNNYAHSLYINPVESRRDQIRKHVVETHNNGLEDSIFYKDYEEAYYECLKYKNKYMEYKKKYLECKIKLLEK